MKFWKFEYEGPSALADCVANRALPSAERLFPGLKNAFAHPCKSMKAGDGVVLATLDGEEGKIFAAGKVLHAATDACLPVVAWAASTKTVLPNAGEGLKNWQTKSAFEISASPATRYGLAEFVNYYVRDDA
jgi:hypothetical protein